MLSTAQVLKLLAQANPARRVTEDTLRSCIRRGDVQLPPLFAGRYAWSSDDVAKLARALGLETPRDESRGRARARRSAEGELQVDCGGPR